MSVPKVIAEARAQVRDFEQQVANEKQLVAEKRATAEKAIAKVNRVRKRLGRAHGAAVAETSQSVLLLSNGLGDLDYGYGGIPENVKRRDRAQYVLDSVTIKAPGDGGPGWKARGAARRIRFITRQTQREIDRLERAARAAERRAYVARDKWSAAKRSAYEASDARATVDEIVAAMVDIGVAKQGLRAAYGYLSDRYQVESAERRLETAKRHLAHAESRSKDPCPCPWCDQKRQQEAYAVRQEEARKQREREDRERERQLRKAPKQRFLCPLCEEWSISVVWKDDEDGPEYVSCEYEDCGGSTPLRDVPKNKRVPASETPRWLEDHIEPAPGQTRMVA